MRNAMRNANGKTLRVVDGPDKLSYASTRRASLEPLSSGSALCVALVAQVDRPLCKTCTKARSEDDPQ